VKEFKEFIKDVNFCKISLLLHDHHMITKMQIKNKNSNTVKYYHLKEQFSKEIY